MTGSTAKEPEDEETKSLEEYGRQEDNKNLTDTKKEDQGDKGVHSFWRQGTACIFDVKIRDSDAPRNTGAPPEKILEKNKK